MEEDAEPWAGWTLVTDPQVQHWIRRAAGLALVYNIKFHLFCTDLVYKVVSVLYRSCVQC